MGTATGRTGDDRLASQRPSGPSGLAIRMSTSARGLFGRSHPSPHLGPMCHAESMRISRLGSVRVVTALVIAALLASPAPAQAYIGPGAGFAVLSSFLVVFTTILVAIASMLIWPFRALWRLVRGQTAPRARIRRLIVVGFDGQDPKLTDRYMKEGELPNFSHLAQTGSYRRLRTTFPSVSPVAWSSFSTGTHPARHNIFDFLDRDLRTYLPLLSSTRVGKVERFFKIGKYLIPRQRPEVRNLRKSKPFWTILGEHRIWSTVLRVPITFPPDRFHGAELSAMCTPDLLGTQGTFLLFTTRPAGVRFKEGGIRVAVEVRGDRIDTEIEGPENTFISGNPLLRIPMTITLDRSARRARLKVEDATLQLEPQRLSEWVTLTFHAAPGINVSGIARFQLLEMDEHFSLYVSPINLNPDKPAMPISHPSYYATYLAKRIGAYSTLGLAEDTWALNEGVTSEGTFLQQTYDIDAERRSMFFAALDRLRRGALVCVFDATDRVQHMFWRYIDDNHPALRGRPPSPHSGAIRELYKKNDALVGEVMQRLRPDDVLMVISDHGFNSFRRGVNLNAWLRHERYLTLVEGADGTSEWLREVDWSRTKAYCLGLTGMFLNLSGREKSGIVMPGAEAEALKAEIAAKLNGLVDTETGDVAIREVFEPAKLYAGPYLANGPDLLIGYNNGYRISWDGATGVIAGSVFADNMKPWSGDHCIDPRLVPGVFFCNRSVEADDPALIDIAPTALQLFGIQPPPYMDGRPFAVGS
jgi:predicted AlkP superfamily phosphohydrolase/phosphomutase